MSTANSTEASQADPPLDPRRATGTTFATHTQFLRSGDDLGEIVGIDRTIESVDGAGQRGPPVIADFGLIGVG